MRPTQPKRRDSACGNCDEDANPGASRHRRGVSTPFPARPSHVVALTVPEFTCGPHLDGTASIDDVCRLFLNDANRALVWFIRYHALTVWRERADMAAWLRGDPAHVRHISEVAAGFALNDAWEFEAEPFRRAVCNVGQAHT